MRVIKTANLWKPFTEEQITEQFDRFVPQYGEITIRCPHCDREVRYRTSEALINEYQSYAFEDLISKYNNFIENTICMAEERLGKGYMWVDTMRKLQALQNDFEKSLFDPKLTLVKKKE